MSFPKWLVLIPFALSSCIRPPNALSPLEQLTRVPLPSGIRSVFSPAWSPDGRQIALVGYGKGPRQDVLLFDVHTMTTDIVLGADEHFLANDVSWSPDGGWLAVSGGSTAGGKARPEFGL